MAYRQVAMFIVEQIDIHQSAPGAENQSTPAPGRQSDARGVAANPV